MMLKFSELCPGDMLMSQIRKTTLTVVSSISAKILQSRMFKVEDNSVVLDDELVDRWKITYYDSTAQKITTREYGLNETVFCNSCSDPLGITLYDMIYTPHAS